MGIKEDIKQAEIDENGISINTENLNTGLYFILLNYEQLSFRIPVIIIK